MRSDYEQFWVAYSDTETHTKYAHRRSLNAWYFLARQRAMRMHPRLVEFLNTIDIPELFD